MQTKWLPASVVRVIVDCLRGRAVEIAPSLPKTRALIEVCAIEIEAGKFGSRSDATLRLSDLTHAADCSAIAERGFDFGALANFAMSLHIGNITDAVDYCLYHLQRKQGKAA